MFELGATAIGMSCIWMDFYVHNVISLLQKQLIIRCSAQLFDIGAVFISITCTCACLLQKQLMKFLS